MFEKARYLSWDACSTTGEDEHDQHERLELLQIEDAAGCADQIQQGGMTMGTDQGYGQDLFLFCFVCCMYGKIF